MINIVCWKWNNGLHQRKEILFTHEHVNILYSMLKRNITVPFRLFCITDDINGIIPEVKTIPLWNDLKYLGGCYVRLKSFHSMMKGLVGEDFFSIDLDVVICKDITELLLNTQQNYEFKIWGDTNPTTPYNGSFYYMKSGSREQVWKNFRPKESPILARSKRYVGTDQAWIGYCLGTRESIWTTQDGVYSYRVHFEQEGRKKLNGQEKIIFFHGCEDPSKIQTKDLVPWVDIFWNDNDIDYVKLKIINDGLVDEVRQSIPKDRLTYIKRLQAQSARRLV